jgi:shikimate kinase
MIFTLVGMPASGKSCMGKAIASKLKMRLLDGDRLIESVTGRKLQEIIDEDGLDAFKKIEEETLLSIEDDNIILAPGGSAVYYDSVMQKCKKRGKIIYIYVSLPLIKERLGDYSKRGVVLKPGQTIDDLYKERTKLYEKYADITINCNGKAYPKYRAELIKKIEECLAK